VIGPTQPVLKDLVLVGGGHSHVGVLRALAQRPLPGLRVTLICTDTHTPYSGMLPGYIAGHYALDDVHIDLSRLCVATGARLIRGWVIGIDRSARRVLCEGRPPLAYDLLSINTGSTPRLDGVPGALEHAVPVKPIASFEQRWQAVLARVGSHSTGFRVVVVGAGAGGVEMTLAMQHRLRQVWRDRGLEPSALQFTLVSATPDVMPTHAAGVRRRFMDVLRQRGVDLRLSRRVVAVGADEVQLRGIACDGSDPETLPSDLTLWVTQAGGPSWLKGTGLALDADGFVRINAHLQSVSDPLVFAAGDVCSFEPRELAKAGVFAVRMGAVLADNLRRALLAQPLRPYWPQRRWLSLISTGDRQAVASWGPVGFGFWGSAVWRWKDHIDRRFMRMFDVSAMSMAASPSLGSRLFRSTPERLPLPPEEQAQALSALAMRCGGCGAKVGPDILARALADLPVQLGDDVLVGLNSPDDAAVVKVPEGYLSVQTVDFFRAFIDDPYVFGQIAAQHALGDLYAMGARPHTALAIVTVPPGLDRQTEDLLRQLMAGAVSVLNEAGCSLVGGHSGEGQELALGFSLTGLLPDQDSAGLRKGGLQPGQALILTKPLGTGVLMAGHARALSLGRWVDAALKSMSQSSAQAAIILREHGATACTDVTGFGLLGHLLEMTRASVVDAQLDASSLPLLAGVRQLVLQGVHSSLSPANARLLPGLAVVDAAHPDAVAGSASRSSSPTRHPERAAQYAFWREVLVDPQTAGGLLAGVPADQAETCLQALRAAGYEAAAIVGQVMASDPTRPASAPVTLIV
jgi:selenide, water dikinase